MNQAAAATVATAAAAAVPVWLLVGCDGQAASATGSQGSKAADGAGALFFAKDRGELLLGG